MFSLLKDGVLRLTDYDGTVLSLDLEGRILIYSNKKITYRRTMQNRYIKIDYSDFRRHVTMLGLGDGKVVEESAIEFINKSERFVEDEETRSILRKIIRKGPGYLDRDADKFRQVYDGGVPIVPPDQYFPIYLQATVGCYWNKCSFCNLYRNKDYRVKKAEEFENHIKYVKEFFGHGISARRGVFLGDANSLAIEQKLLIKDLGLVRKEFGLPIYSFVDSITTQRVKTKSDLSEIKGLGLERIYLGLESGSQKVLKLLNKPMDLDEASKLIMNVKSAGISVGLIILAGAGGKKYYADHVKGSSEFISKLDLERNDIIYISPLYIYQELPYASATKELGKLERIDEEEQYLLIKSKIKEKYREYHGSELESPVVLYDLVESVY
ncbi:MAG: radical SAM protein [Nitrososphaeria archaeon]